MGLVSKLFGVFLLCCSVQAVHAVPLLFWSANGSTIQRAQTDGSGLTDMVTGQSFAVGVAVDADAQKVYWNDQGNPGAIRRSNVDGTDIEDVTSSVRGARGMDLDTTGQWIYWGDVASQYDSINRVRFDGTGFQQLVSVGESSGVALDLGGGKVYWADRVGGKVQRANLDGSVVETLVAGLGELQEIELDVGSGKMYITDSSNGKILRANLNGTGLETLVDSLNVVMGLALDLVNSTMYWTESFGGTVNRANLDGSGITTILSGLNRPRYLDLADVPLPGTTVPEPTTVALLVAGLAGMGSRLRMRKQNKVA